MEQNHPLLLVGSEGEGNVHTRHSLISLQPGVRALSQESDGHDGRFWTVVPGMDFVVLEVFTSDIGVFDVLDEIRRVDVEVLDAASEILVHHQTFLHVGHSTQVKLEMRVECMTFIYR